MSRQTQPGFKWLALAFPCLLFCCGQAVLAQEPAPILTLNDAVESAVRRNADYTNSRDETARAGADLDAFSKRLLPSFNVIGIGAQLLTRPQITFPAGSFGSYGSTGPIPANDTSITVPRRVVGAVSATATQPLTTLYRIELGRKAMLFGLQATRQDEQRKRLEVVANTRKAYYEVASAQGKLASSTASLPFYEESVRLAKIQYAQETILQSELLGAETRLAQAKNTVSDATDQLETDREKLNDLMGRDVHTEFRADESAPEDTTNETRDALEAEALANRPDVKKAQANVNRATYDRRSKSAEYIPDVSGAVSYYSTFNFGSVIPSNVAFAGLSLTWEPWDFGRKKDEARSKRAVEDEAHVALAELERSVRTQVSEALRRVQSARRQLQVSALNQAAQRERLRELQQQVAQEARLKRDLLQPQSDLAAADSQRSDAIAAYWEALADLKQALGEE